MYGNILRRAPARHSRKRSLAPQGYNLKYRILLVGNCVP